MGPIAGGTGMVGGAASGPSGAVDWSLAERAAREVARADDRPPTAEERTRLRAVLEEVGVL